MARRISPDPRAWDFSVLLTVSERKALERLSRETRMSMSHVIRAALAEYAQKRERTAA